MLQMLVVDFRSECLCSNWEVYICKYQQKLQLTRFFNTFFISTGGMNSIAL